MILVLIIYLINTTTDKNKQNTDLLLALAPFCSLSSHSFLSDLVWQLLLCLCLVLLRHLSLQPVPWQGLLSSGGKPSICGPVCTPCWHCPCSVSGNPAHVTQIYRPTGSPDSIPTGIVTKNTVLLVLAPGLSSSSLNSSPPTTSATSPTRPSTSCSCASRPALLSREAQPSVRASAYPPGRCCPRPATWINIIRPCGRSTRALRASHRASSARARALDHSTGHAR